jgi:two-component system cell cycle sensor histidine kinase/response regulator CckA
MSLIETLTVRTVKAIQHVQSLVHRPARSVASTHQKSIQNIDLEVLRILIEDGSDFITILDAEGTILYESPSVMNALGYHVDEARQRNVFDLLHPEDVEAVKKEFAKGIVIPGYSTKLNCRIRRKDGTWRLLKVTAKNLLFNPRVAGIVVNSRDITDQRKADEGRTMLEYALRGISECVSITDLEDNILFVNDAFLRTYGFEQVDLIGKKIDVVRSPANKIEMVREILPATIKGGWQGDLMNVRKGGSEFAVHLSTSIIRDDKDIPMALIGVATDITEQKKTEEGLKSALSLLSATLESTADGILVVNANGTIASYNKKFLEMWKIPSQIISTNLDSRALEFVLDQLKNPQQFISKVNELYSQPEAQSYDILEFKDGRIYERYSQPQRIGGKSVGRVWSFRDITDRRKAEEKYLQLFEESMDVVFISTPEGKFIDINRAGVQLLGYSSKEEMLGISIANDLFYDPKEWQEYQRTLTKEGFIRDFELTLRKKNGEKVIVLETNTPVRDERGRITAYRGIVRDITEKKRAQEALELQRSYFEQLFENSPAGIVVLDIADTVLTANRAFQEMFQYHIEEIRGRKLNDYIVPEHLKHEGKALSQQAQNRHVVQKETKRMRKDGTFVDVAITGYPIIINNDLVGIYGLYVDVTAQRNLEQQLRQSQKMESIGTLAGGIAHDFNNILTIILGHARLLERNKDDARKLGHSIDTISKAADRGTGLVRQLLTFARKTEPLFESLNVNGVIEELARLLSETFPRNIEISLKLSASLPSIVADATQVHQALLNLSVNARDAMSEGGILSFETTMVPGIALSKRFLNAKEEEYVCISVGDTGVGMDDTIRGRIFEPFFTTKGRGKGTGLGLAVIYGVMGAHNGFIDVDSRLGKGTLFRLYFPAQPKGVDLFAKKEQPIVEVKGGTETLLVVEDEEVLRELVKDSLAEKGYTVFTAQDGEDALKIYSEHSKDISLVLSDMGLPRLTGFNLFLSMKSIDPQVKMILASGYLDPDQKSEILKAGVKYFVQKPYSPEELLANIRELLDADKRL